MESNITTLGEHLVGLLSVLRESAGPLGPKICVFSQVENCLLAKTKFCLHMADFFSPPTEESP